MILYTVMVLCLFQWTNGEDAGSRRGGEDTPYTPDWLASLEKDGKFVCYGALIDPTWVMASAPCAKRGIATVSLDNCGEEKKDNCKLRTSVAKIAMHPAWWGGAKTDDIALIQLKKPFPAGRTLKLSNRKRDRTLQEMDKQECYELDWVKGSKEADHLPVGLSLDSACDRVFQSHPIKDPVCSFSRGRCPRKSTSNPTVCKLGKKMFLVGFTAASKDEGNRCITGLTRASRYPPWIRNTMRSADKTNVRTGGRCVPMTKGSPCAESGAVCSPEPYSYRCRCKAGACGTRSELPENQSIGYQCWTEASLPCADDNAICQSNGRPNVLMCQCMENYFVNDQNVCEPSPTITAECSTASDCGTYMECQTSQCQCRLGYGDRGDGYCRYVGYALHMPCLDDTDCAVNNTICRVHDTHRRCVCVPDYKVVNDSVCVACADGERADSDGLECYAAYTLDDECQIRYKYACPGESECVRAPDSKFRCLCPFDFKSVGGECVPCPEGQGQNPAAEDQCMLVVNAEGYCTPTSLCAEHSECTNNECLCGFGRSPLNGKCYETPGSGIGGECVVDIHCRATEVCADDICVCQEGYSGIQGSCAVNSCPDGSYLCLTSSYNNECVNTTGCSQETSVCKDWSGGLYLDGNCNMPHGFLCLGDFMCDETLGLACSNRKHCECQNEMEWRDSTCRPPLDS